MDTLSGTFEVSGASLFYTQTNRDADETIVMVHAGICDQRMWQTQVADLGKDYHVITFDLYGFGQSTTPTQPFAFHQDIVALLDHLEIERAWFLACSLGGAITLDVALTHPERLKGLVLVAPAIGGFAYDGDPHPLVAEIDAADEAGDLARVNELEIQMWFDGAGRSAEDMNPATRQLVLDMNRITLEADDSYWEQKSELDTPAIERLSEIAMPTLIIGGSRDTPASLERLNIAAVKIRDAQRVVIPDTAHLPNMEQSSHFNQHVRDFIAQSTH